MENENFDAVLWGDVLLFPDGTMMERSLEGKGITITPDSDEKRCRLIVEYWKTKLKLAVQEFDLQKKNRMRYARSLLSNPANTAPAETTEDAVKTLTELRRKVLFYRERLAEAESELQKFQRPAKELAVENLCIELTQDYLAGVEKIEI